MELTGLASLASFSRAEATKPEFNKYSFLVLFQQEHFKERSKFSGGLDLYTDIALAGSYFTYNLLNMMYCGPQPTQVELRCSHLLNSKLLQR